VAAVGGTGIADRGKARSHVFRSADGGLTWEDIDGGQLPDTSYNAILFETHQPYRVFVGGDCGVWMLDHAQGSRWQNVSGNLPSVIVSDLAYHHNDRLLFAATHGRGIWRLQPHEIIAFQPVS
jgi:photosystem II stability/assembly factor-like uncharacterized protein